VKIGRWLSFLSVLAFVFLWEILTVNGWLDPRLFPPWHRIFLRAAELWTDPVFLGRDVAASLSRLAIAGLISLPLAVLAGFLCGLSQTVRAFLLPFVNFTFPLPKVAIFPLVLAIFGIGDSGKVFLIAVGLFYPLFINAFSGVAGLVESELHQVVKVYCLKPRQIFYQYYFKGISRELIAGLKASLGYGFTLMIVSELTASNDGMGNFIWRAWDSYNVLDMYAGVFTFCLLGWSVQTLLDQGLKPRRARF
jgi:NitT/TauT family transport system permease protein